MSIYLIALLAVIFLGVYDYLHDKTGWTLKGNLVKYGVCLGVAWFYATVSKLGIFQDLEIAGIVVLSGMFTGVILKWLTAIWAWIKSLTAKKS